MANGHGDFTNDELGVRRHNSSTEDTTVTIGKEFKKAVVKIVDFADGEVVELDDNFAIFAVATEKIVFV